MRTHRGQPCTITCCTFCGRVKKFGIWIELTLRQLQKINDNPTKYSIVLETCPGCNNTDLELLGLA